jgi:predicted lipid-binding transport protein (Tim44 family)
MIRFRLRSLLAMVAVVSALALVAGDVMARPGGKSGGGFGSRGSRTYTAPAPTATAPNAARPMERTMTQPGAATAARPGAAAGAQPGGMFSRPGFLGGLAAGFLGAGLLGMLFGGGLFGGLGGMASILGLLAQLAIAGGIAYLIVRWWQRRSQPAQQAAAYAGPAPSPRQMYDEPQQAQQSPRSILSALGGGGAQTPQQSAQIEITGDDFDAFERLLGDVQTAYSREDLGKLRTLATPEMLSYFSEELAGNASSGIVNELSDVKLLQGDLSESWSEGNVEYATVAMRFELIDKMVERASGRVVEGSDKPTEAVELWTFMRSRGGTWLLSAIQQT